MLWAKVKEKNYGRSVSCFWAEVEKKMPKLIVAVITVEQLNQSYRGKNDGSTVELTKISKYSAIMKGLEKKSTQEWFWLTLLMATVGLVECLTTRICHSNGRCTSGGGGGGGERLTLTVSLLVSIRFCQMWSWRCNGGSMEEM